jgi:hypothetical protein
VGDDGVIRQRAGCGIVSFFFLESDVIFGENILEFKFEFQTDRLNRPTHDLPVDSYSMFGDINQLYSSDTATEQVGKHFTDAAKAKLDSEWRESVHKDTAYLYSTYTLLV